MTINMELRVPYGYSTGTRTLREIQNILLAHYHPEYVRRIIPWLASKDGWVGIGGHWRPDGTQPDKAGFAPEGKSFHQNQQYRDGFIGATAVDLVVRRVSGIHRSPYWTEVPDQYSKEAEKWGLHCNIATEAWHMQPIEIDGWQTWMNAGRPFPRKDYPIPTVAPTVPPSPIKEGIVSSVTVQLETLTEGVRSEDARRCQALLNRRAISHGSAPVVAEDGHYGPQTAGIIKFVQGEEGTTMDGICGPKTWTVLLER